MTPVRRFLRDLGERTFGTYYEGPEPPRRILRYADEFARDNPRATRREWLDFARRLAATAYQEGYVRGDEQVSRDPDRYTRLPPELEGGAMGPDWERMPAGIDLENPNDLVEETIEPAALQPDLEPDPMIRQIALMARDMEVARRHAAERAARHRAKKT